MLDQEKSNRKSFNHFSVTSNRKILFTLASLFLIAGLALILRMLTAAQAAEAVFAPHPPQPQPTIGQPPQPIIEWAQQFGSSQRDAHHYDSDRNGDMTIGGNGVYVVGNTDGTVDPLNPNQGGTDVWLARYNIAGQRQWIRQLGTGAEDRVTEVVADNSGNVFIGGYTMGAFPGYGNPGNYDFWVASYNSSGVFQWVTQDGTSGQDGKYGLAIAPDGSGGGKLVTFWAERRQLKTYSFDDTGQLTFQNLFNMQRYLQNTPYDLALGPDKSVYVVGEFINGNIMPAIRNKYVIKFDGQGNQTDIDTRKTGTDESAGRDLVDADEVVYVAGVTLAGDAWVNKYMPDRSLAWSRPIASSGEDVINAIGIGSGSVIVGGMTKGTLGEENNPDNLEDAWFARLRSNNGAITLLRQFPKRGDDGFNALAGDACGNTILSGYTVNFVSNIGAEDALLMRYASPPGGGPFQPVFSTTPNIGHVGDPIIINLGNVFHLNGVYFNDGVEASIIRWTGLNSLTVRVPQGATTGDVTITTHCIHLKSPTPFTVLP